MAIKRSQLIWIEPQLSSGGMADIWRVINRGAEGVQNLVVVKRILLNYLEDIEFKKMFIDEAKITAQLHKPIPNPNIIQILEFQQHEDEYLLFLEYVNGPDIRKIVTKCRQKKIQLPIAYSLQIISDVLSGLFHAHTLTDIEGHKMNIIHRDISPQNILVSYAGDVKIIDWGIADAKMRSTETVVGVIKGKYGYMSPEQANAEDLDFRSDLYSTGIVLWEMLTLHKLFAHENDLKVLRKIQKSEIESPCKYNPEVSKNLETIVLKSLSKDREKRFRDCLEFSQALNAERNRIAPAFSKVELSRFLQKIFEEEIKKDQLVISQAEKQVPSEIPPAPRRSTPPKRPPEDPAQNGIGIELDKIGASGLELEAQIDRHSASITPVNEVSQRINSISYGVRTQNRSIFYSTLKMIPVMLIILLLLMIGGILYLNKQPAVNINPGPVSQFKLNPASGRVIEVSSPLKGLKIKVAGLSYYKEDVGPLIIEDLPEQNQYLIEVSKTGYETVTEIIKIENNTKFTLTINHMNPVGATGSLFVDTDPPGANIFINDVKTGHVTPCTVSLPVGEEVEITIKRHGYMDKAFKLNVNEEDSFIKKNFTLKAMRGVASNGKVPAILKIDSDPPKAHVYIDDDFACYTPCIYKSGYVDDILNIDIKQKGYEKYFISFPLKDAHNYLNASLSRIAEGTGYVSIVSVPQGEIIIDDKPIGKRTPLSKYELKAGRHKIKIVSKTGDKERFAVKVIAVNPGEHVRKKLILK